MYYKSPLGCLQIKGIKNSISGITFCKQKTHRHGGRDAALIDKRVTACLEQYFGGKESCVDVLMEYEGTSFQKSVWQALLKIPYGKTETYATIAKRIRKPKAVRAVGTAIGKNPISILIPCHRVTRKDSLGQYAWGVEKKEWLLRHENAIANAHHG